MDPDSPLPRLTDGVAQHLRAMVHSGEILPRHRFPAERELAARLSVSRETLREALRQLQKEGYVEVRRGPQGGAYVTGLEIPAQSWRQRMRQDESAVDELFDFRVAVEMASARFAALRRTGEDLYRMQRAVSAMVSAGNRDDFRLHDSRFHEAVAAAARSPRLQRSVRQARGEIFTPMDLLGIPTSPQDDAERHTGILEAIRERDEALAAARMSEHVEHTREHLRSILTASAETGDLGGPQGQR
ncbi:FadR/GntR family transcriptional regulator [Nesterenkonia muleiensis]|uniref:FadR/GntR family transcriptional regulator n=1 Tax=Nesterenkonia muleiensis TaxID=2282648 RepID=UPI000E736BDF|nr:FCD domain-containing protein [Nesterenkonia muleiensis]